jgi:hypothetical protein
MSENYPEPELVLPPELVARIEEDNRKGIYYGMDRLTRKTTKIFWRPGDPNALAEAIIENVNEGPMDLELDGHRYTIVKS